MDVLLFLHVMGAVLFLGNIVTAAFWKVRGDHAGEPNIAHSVSKNIMLADFVFTLPGLGFIIISGILMTIRAGYPLSDFNWLTLSLLLFGLTGILWLAVLLPLQRKMIRFSEQSIESGRLSSAYRRASRLWAVFGTITTLLPVVILFLMINKGL